MLFLVFIFLRECLITVTELNASIISLDGVKVQFTRQDGKAGAWKSNGVF